MILDDMVKLFLDSRKRGTGGAKKKCTPATVEIYSRNLDIFLGYLQVEVKEGGVTSYKSIKRPHLSAFIDWMDEKVKAEQWSKATMLQLLRSLRTFFRWVDTDEECQEDGLKGMQKYLPVIEKTPRRIDIPANVDMKKFRTSFNTDNRWGYRDFVVTCLLMTNGMRIGEVCNLRLDHMLLDQNLLLVTGKTGARPVPVTNEMGRLLRGWLKRRAICRYAVESPFVFVSKYKPRMEPNGFGQRFRKHVKKHGLPRITPHTFRHAFSTNYLKNGGDIEKLRNITGHASYTMLMDYLHLAKVGSKSAQEELERVNPLKDI